MRQVERLTMAQKQEKQQLMETVPEEAQTSYLLNKDFKLVTLNIFKELKDTIYKELT